MLHKQYIDDIIFVLEALDRKLRYVMIDDGEGRLHMVEELSNKAADIRSMKFLRLVGDYVLLNIHLEPIHAW